MSPGSRGRAAIITQAKEAGLINQRGAISDDRTLGAILKAGGSADEASDVRRGLQRALKTVAAAQNQVATPERRAAIPQQSGRSGEDREEIRRGLDKINETLDKQRTTIVNIDSAEAITVQQNSQDNFREPAR